MRTAGWSQVATSKKIKFLVFKIKFMRFWNKILGFFLLIWIFQQYFFFAKLRFRAKFWSNFQKKFSKKLSFSTFGGIKFLLKCTKKPDFGKYFLNQARMAQPLSAKNGKLKEQSATIQPKTQIPKISQELNFALKLSSKPSKNWVFKEIWSQNHEKNGQFWFKNLQTFGKLRSSIAKLSFSERS